MNSGGLRRLPSLDSTKSRTLNGEIANVNKLNISVLIPDTTLEETKDHVKQAQKVYQIARTLTIFRVDTVYIYRALSSDLRRQRWQGRILSAILEYLETPQYLRKILIDKMPELKSVGTLSPLAAEHHPLKEKPRAGIIREGALFEKSGKYLVELGFQHPFEAINVKPAANLKNRIVRVTARLEKNDDRKAFVARILTKEELEKKYPWYYNGYRVKVKDTTLGKLLKGLKGFKVATDRTCEHINPLKFVEDWKRRRTPLLVAFGSPKHGIPSILKQEGLKIHDVFDGCIGLIKNSAVRTIRLEEALMMFLSQISPFL